MSSQHQRNSTRLELISDVLTADFEKKKKNTFTKVMILWKPVSATEKIKKVIATFYLTILTFSQNCEI